MRTGKPHFHQEPAKHFKQQPLLDLSKTALQSQKKTETNKEAPVISLSIVPPSTSSSGAPSIKKLSTIATEEVLEMKDSELCAKENVIVTKEDKVENLIERWQLFDGDLRKSKAEAEVRIFHIFSIVSYSIIICYYRKRNWRIEV